MKRYAALPVVLLAATAILMALAWQQHREAGKPWTFLVAESAAGLMISAGGVLIWLRRPQNRCGWLLLAAGLSFWFGDFEHATRSVGSWSFAFGLWYDAFLAWAVLAFPLGRLTTRPERTTVAAIFALVGIRTLSRLFLFVPADTAGYGTSNRYLPIHDDRWWRGVDDWFDRLFPLAIVVVFGLVLIHWIRSSRPGRRMLSPGLFAAVLLAASVGYSNIVGWNAGVGPRGNIRAFYVVWLAHGVVALALAIGMERLRGTRSRVIDLLSELNTSAPPRGLGRALGRALGDPNLTLVPWSAEVRAFVDDGGVRVDPDDVGAHRATTVIERQGEPFALLVHDEALLEDPGLVNAVVAAIRLTSDNELLQFELRAQLAEVAASRSRIMEAGDLERQKIERNLHDGAQQRLVTTALSLRLAEAQLSDSSDPRVNEILSKAIAQLAEAITELRDLGRGIHPAVLTEFGLGPALNSLANRLPLPVDLEVDLPSNLPYAVSSTAYFAVSEALTNVVKHANATTVSVRARVCHDFLRVEVADDGSGGADVDAGTGLSGIADRIATVGGSLQIESPIGDGTRFALELPCASS